MGKIEDILIDGNQKKSFRYSSLSRQSGHVPYRRRSDTDVGGKD